MKEPHLINSPLLVDSNINPQILKISEFTYREKAELGNQEPMRVHEEVEVLYTNMRKMADYMQDRFEDVMNELNGPQRSRNLLLVGQEESDGLVSKSLQEELTVIIKTQLSEVLASNVGNSAPNLLTSGEDARPGDVPLEVDLRPLGTRRLVGQVRRNGAPLELDSVFVKRFDESTGNREDVEVSSVQQDSAASLVVIELETDALVPGTIFTVEVIAGGVIREHLVTVN